MTNLPPNPAESSKPSDESDNASIPQSAADMLAMVPISSVIEQLEDAFPDITVSKIRFLESRGLVHPHRADSGYRRYSPSDIGRLRWVLTMQRDHFLPLRVIKERLDSGELTTEVDEGDQVPKPELPARTPSSRFRAPGPETDRLTPEDLARMAGLSAAQLADLVKFGLVEPVETDEGPRYERGELHVAKATQAFLAHGIEARHLKAWRVAAEREAGMLEQIIMPITRQSTPDATTRAREVADELVDKGNAIREAIIVKVLRESLGYSGD